MILVFGLGNPGKKYERTPHNAGFLVLDQIAQSLNIGDFKEKFGESLFIKTKRKNNDLILIKPQTFMNNSGAAAAQFKNFFKAANENIIIIHDDIDLPFGQFKESFDSGAAGHKGVQSIINAVGGKNFYRLRIGICPKEKPNDLEDYVTKKIPEDYEDIFFETVNNAARIILKK